MPWTGDRPLDKFSLWWLGKTRFEAKVDRSGTCHLWTGAKTASGVGQARVDGKLRTAAQLGWQLEHGPVPGGGRVRSCKQNKLCVRTDHLEMDITPVGVETQRRKRGERGNGSMREVVDGKWKLTVDARIDSLGSRRRISRTVRGTRKEATRALGTFSAEVQSGQQRPIAQGGDCCTVCVSGVVRHGPRFPAIGSEDDGVLDAGKDQ